MLLSMPIMIDGMERDLKLWRGETVNTAALTFATTYGLDQLPEFDSLVDQLSSMLTDRLDSIQTMSDSARLLFKIPIQVDGETFEFDMYDTQTIPEAIHHFFTRYHPTIPATMHETLIPQLERIVQQRFHADNAPMFQLTITIGDQAFEIAHYEHLDPMDEAQAFCEKQQIRVELRDELVPKIASLIQAEIKSKSKSKSKSNPPQRRRVLVNVPVAINDEQYDLVHYEGATPIESAIQFLKARGFSDNNDVLEQHVPALVNMIEQQLMASSTSVVSIPIVMGETNVQLNHFVHQSPEQTATSFMEQQGLANDDPQFNQYVTQLAALIRQHVQAQEQEQQNEPPLFTLPISLGGQVHEFAYFDQQHPGDTALAFCKEKAGYLTASNESDEILSQINECAHFMAQTIVSVLNRLTKEAEASAPSQQPKAALLFTLDINLGNDQVAQLPFYARDDPRVAATEFCNQVGIGIENIAALEQAIHDQIAQLA